MRLLPQLVPSTSTPWVLALVVNTWFVLRPLDAQDAQAPSDAQVAALVAQLDGAFNDRDLEAYLAHFAPSHGETHAVFERWLTALLTGKARLERASTVQRVERMGAYAIGEVHSSVGLAGRPDGPSFDHVHLLVTRLSGAATEATLQVEVAPGHASIGEFRCPACNYRMGGIDGWAVAFLSQDRTRCMEAINFYRLDSDVTVELSVHLADMAEPVSKTMASLCSDLRQARGDLEFDPAWDWTPPAHCDDELGFDGAATIGTDATGTLELYVVVRGAMRFTLCVRGPQRVLASRRAEIDELLGTFELLDTTIGVDDMLVQAASMHTGGGVIEQGRYRNEKHRIAFDLPPGWDHVVRPGPFLFRMTLHCPEQRNRLWITAYRPPGSSTWHRPLAERMVVDHVARMGLEQPTAPEWRDTAGGFALASWQIPGTAPRREIWALLADDLLMIVDGAIRDESTQEQMLQTVRSAARR